jgi:hypothetical protein
MAVLHALFVNCGTVPQTYSYSRCCSSRPKPARHCRCIVLLSVGVGKIVGPLPKRLCTMPSTPTETAVLIGVDTPPNASSAVSTLMPWDEDKVPNDPAIDQSTPLYRSNIIPGGVSGLCHSTSPMWALTSSR